MLATNPLRHQVLARSLDDRELVERCRAGDETAWSELVARYGRLLQCVARSCGLDDGGAADAAQTAWCELFVSLDRLHDGAAVRSWLTTTVRRAAIATWRRRRQT